MNPKDPSVNFETIPKIDEDLHPSLMDNKKIMIV